MAPRTLWRGYRKLSLVTCPVAMARATSENEKVRFHALNRSTGNRIVSRYVDSITGKVVGVDDEVRGYQRAQWCAQEDQLQGRPRSIKPGAGNIRPMEKFGAPHTLQATHPAAQRRCANGGRKWQTQSAISS